MLLHAGRCSLLTAPVASLALMGHLSFVSTFNTEYRTWTNYSWTSTSGQNLVWTILHLDKSSFGQNTKKILYSTIPKSRWPSLRRARENNRKGSVVSRRVRIFPLAQTAIALHAFLLDVCYKSCARSALNAARVARATSAE